MLTAKAANALVDAFTSAGRHLQHLRLTILALTPPFVDNMAVKLPNLSNLDLIYYGVGRGPYTAPYFSWYMSTAENSDSPASDNAQISFSNEMHARRYPQRGLKFLKMIGYLRRESF